MTAAFQTLDMDTDARGVATMTLSRPEKHNALNDVLIRELREAAERIARDDGVRVVVLTGEGKSFCAGGDIGWFAANMERSRTERVAQSAEQRKAAWLCQGLTARNGHVARLVARHFAQVRLLD